jgi:arylsulfatase A-like enzyme
MRRSRLWIASALSAVLFASCEGALAERPHHVILVTVDAVRADHLSCYRDPRPAAAGSDPLDRASPSASAIDDLAAQGTLFTRAFAPSGETIPSIAAILTGRPPLETCAIGKGDVLHASERTLAEALKEGGFRTAAFTANPLLSQGSGIEQGFDHFALDPSPDRDEGVLRSAEGWLASQELAAGPPLFVWLHLSSMNPTEPTETARIDDLVGRFLSYCSGKESNQPVDMLSNSLVVFTACHGEKPVGGGRDSGQSKSVYGSVLHVPLIVRHPASIAAGRRIERLVELEDLAPTVLDLFRLGAEQGMHGRSLAHVLRGGLADPRPAFGLRSDGTCTVRDERWLLVWPPGRIEPTDGDSGPSPIRKIALFDVSADPGETTDLSSSHPEVVAQLQDAIRKWEAGLDPCTRSRPPPTPERIRVLRDLGYLEDVR